MREKFEVEVNMKTKTSLVKREVRSNYADGTFTGSNISIRIFKILQNNKLHRPLLYIGKNLSPNPDNPDIVHFFFKENEHPEISNIRIWNQYEIKDEPETNVFKTEIITYPCSMFDTEFTNSVYNEVINIFRNESVGFGEITDNYSFYDESVNHLMNTTEKLNSKEDVVPKNSISSRSKTEEIIQKEPIPSNKKEDPINSNTTDLNAWMSDLLF